MPGARDDLKTMLGWNIGVYRQGTEATEPATFESDSADRVAVWQTGLGGLRWIDDLVEQGRAVALGGNGYPLRYTARAADLVPVIEQGPPNANTHWIYGVNDTLGPAWDGKTVFHEDVARDCSPDEWLLIEAWDES